MRKILRKSSRMVALILCMAMIFLSGCGKSLIGNGKKNDGSVNSLKDSLSKVSDSLAEAGEKEAQKEAENDGGQDDALGTEDELTDEEKAYAERKEPQYIKMQNPDWEFYYGGEYVEPYTNVSLKQVSKKGNDITNFSDWCEEVGFEPVYDRYCFTDNYYIYKLYGDERNGENWSQYMLDICDLSSGDPMYTLDFSDFHMPDWIMEGDEFFVDENIHWVTCVDDILYVSMFHNTYAESAPHNGYIMAIDMKKDFRIIWKTEPLTCNTDNFIVTGDAVICGYGFTKEDDFVYVLDKDSGVRKHEYKVKTGPDYFHLDGNKLYVRCYDTDYVFDVIEE